MRTAITKISTTVRHVAQLYGLRLGFAVGGWLAPEATMRRAAELFCTPFASTRRRAWSALVLCVTAVPKPAAVRGRSRHAAFRLDGEEERSNSACGAVESVSTR